MTDRLLMPTAQELGAVLEEPGFWDYLTGSVTASGQRDRFGGPPYARLI